MSALTRRGALALAGSLGASVGVGAGLAAAMPPLAPQEPDAELIALGAQYDAVCILYREAAARSDAAWAVFQAQVKVPVASPAWWEERARLCDADGDAVCCHAEALDDLTNRIRAIPARTFKGIAVKARTLRHDLCQWADRAEPKSEWDWDTLCLEEFIEQMQALGEVSS